MKYGNTLRVLTRLAAQRLHPCFIIMAGAIALLTLSSCATRTIYVPHGEPVKLAEPVTADVWLNDNGVAVKSRMTIPEGWYALPRD